jgi:hypothetical protein
VLSQERHELGGQADGSTASAGFHVAGRWPGVTPVRAPKARPHAEPGAGSVRRECLDRILIVGRRRLRHVLATHAAHYNEHRRTAHSHNGHRSVRRRRARASNRRGDTSIASAAETDLAG